MQHTVFVYGSLLSGLHNHRRFMRNAEFKGDDTITGPYLMEDYGHFPGLIHVNGRPDKTVKGEVYTVDDRTLDNLDRLEGVPHHYARVPKLTDGGTIAWVYVRNKDTVDPAGRFVPDCDWRQHYSNFRNNRENGY